MLNFFSKTKSENANHETGFFAFVKRWTKRFVYLCLFTFIILFLTIFFSDHIIKGIINHSANYMDLNMSVEDVSVRLITQQIVFKNIKLKNPDAFPDNDALSASKLQVKYNMFDLHNPIKRIYLQNAKIRVEGRSGRRIMAKSFFQSNIYAIAREFGRVFDVKVEKYFFKDKSEKVDKAEDKSADYFQISDDIKRLGGLDEIRLENVSIENGKDLYAFGSLSFHNGLGLISSFKTTIFGVNSYMRNAFFNIEKGLFGFSGFSIKNPEGYLKNNVFSIKKFMLKIAVEKDKKGVGVPHLESIEIDSPQIYFEDKNGSMLGAIGMDNNFKGLYDTVNSMTRSNLRDMFQDEFESVPKEREFKLPEFVVDNISITNARVVSSKKDAGFLANNIKIHKNLIEIDDIRAHIGGMRLELAGVDLDSKSQLFSASNFSIKNPAGFPEENAFKFKNFVMSTNFSEKVIRGNRVVAIDKIEVNNFYVRLDSRTSRLYDLLGDDNNLYALLDAINATTASMPVYKAAVQAGVDESKTTRPYRYIVKSIKFTGGRIFIGPKGDAIKIPFDDVVRENLGVEERGLTSQEITTSVLKEIILNSIDGAQDKVSEEIGGVVLAPIISVLRILISAF